MPFAEYQYSRGDARRDARGNALDVVTARPDWLRDNRGAAAGDGQAFGGGRGSLRATPRTIDAAELGVRLLDTYLLLSSDAFFVIALDRAWRRELRADMRERGQDGRLSAMPRPHDRVQHDRRVLTG